MLKRSILYVYNIERFELEYIWTISQELKEKAQHQQTKTENADRNKCSDIVTTYITYIFIALALNTWSHFSCCRCCCHCFYFVSFGFFYVARLLHVFRKQRVFCAVVGVEKRRTRFDCPIGVFFVISHVSNQKQVYVQSHMETLRLEGVK